MVISQTTLGGVYAGEGCSRFRVWAPKADLVEVHIISPKERFVKLTKQDYGYHSGTVEDASPGIQYMYRLDAKKERPDPASRCQPHGVHNPSQIIDNDYPWKDFGWCGIPLSRYIIYELHVGTFSSEGTFDAIISYLDELKDLGITAIELMPVSQFPGERNWGYDGVYPFAVQNSYGGPNGLKRLVEACHLKGLAVILDVVYNHLGPEGNYFNDYGFYFSNRYKSFWGEPLNFDGPYSDEIRRFFIENALFWITQYHIDALRLDAVHGIFDFSAYPFLQELTEMVRIQAERLNRRIHLIPESDLNDTRLVRSAELAGFGMDAQWNDDFHHSLHTLLTGEQTGYYRDFGDIKHLIKAYREGFVYSGQYSAHRKRRHGNSSRSISANSFVVFAQNHDQTGNRMRGDRLSSLVSFEALKLAAGCVLLSPFIPLLFMGEEYGETAPFPYFISHSDKNLIEAVRKGRKSDFASFSWAGEPPDPQNDQTFMSAKLNHLLRRQPGSNQILYEYYRELMRLRKEVKALSLLSKENMEVNGSNYQKTIFIRRWTSYEETFIIAHPGDATVLLSVPLPAGNWEKLLDSKDEKWQPSNISRVPVQIESDGEVAIELSAYAFILFTRNKECK